MAKVHYSLLDDMEKYNKNFDRKLYEEREEDEVKVEFKEIYSKNLPIDLLAWCRVNEPKDEMIYKQGYGEQIMFIRDTINSILYSSYEEYKDNPVMVIGTHTSKSIKLPVYEINLKKHGLKMIIRNNFYDWKISLISNTDVNIDFMDLFKEDEIIHSVYCEGFKEEQVFGSFKDNKKQFTIEIGDKFRVYTFMYLLNNYLKSKK